MKVNYDASVDAVYIELTKGKYAKSRKITDAIIVDEDKKGRILGIEILDAKRNVESFDVQYLASQSQQRGRVHI